MKDTLRSTVSLTVGRGSTVVISGINFIFVARALGAEGYGVYGSVLAIVTILYPLACWGTPLLLVQRYTEGYGFRHLPRFGRLLALSAPLCTGIALATGYFMMPAFDPRTACFIVLMVGSEVVLLTGHEMCFSMYLATNRIYRSVPYTVSLAAMRLAGNLLLIALGWFSLMSLALVQVATSGIVLYSFIRGVARDLRHLYGGTGEALPRLGVDVSMGCQFGVLLWFNSVLGNIDKTMLPRLAGLGTAGLYSSGSRVVDMAFMPMMALFIVIFPRYFLAGQSGKAGVWRFMGKIFPWTLGYALAANLLLFVLAPLLRSVLGRDYTDLSVVVRWVSPVLICRALYYPMSDALTGLKQQGLRIKILLTMMVANVLLNSWWIPAWGWKGAAIARLVCETGLVVGMGAGLLWCTASPSARPLKWLTS